MSNDCKIHGENPTVSNRSMTCGGHRDWNGNWLTCTCPRALPPFARAPPSALPPSALPPSALPPSALPPSALPPQPPAGRLFRHCSGAPYLPEAELRAMGAECMCGKCPPPEPVPAWIETAGSLRAMTGGGSGSGGLRTLTGPEEEYEAEKAAAAKRANPDFEPPRDSWFWSNRVEELYQTYLARPG